METCEKKCEGVADSCHREVQECKGKAPVSLLSLLVMHRHFQFESMYLSPSSFISHAEKRSDTIMQWTASTVHLKVHQLVHPPESIFKAVLIIGYMMVSSWKGMSLAPYLS